MCGLAGIAGNFLTNSDIEAFEDLLLVTSLRGIHSTGVGIVRKEWAKKQEDDDYVCKTWRLDSNAWDFLSCDNYRKDIRSNAGSNKAFFGHCRHATKGEISLKNAHPFIVKNIIGMHNGTIEGTFDYRDEYDTDSEALFRNIAEKGLKEALEHIEASATHTAYAIVYFDTDNNTLNFIRNDQRPLVCAYTTSMEKILWASEEPFLDLTEDRNPIILQKPWFLAPRCLLSLNVDNVNIIKSRTVTKDFIEPPPKKSIISYIHEYEKYGYYDKKTQKWVEGTQWKGDFSPKSDIPFDVTGPQTKSSTTNNSTGSKGLPIPTSKSISDKVSSFLPGIKPKKAANDSSYIGFNKVVLSRDLAQKYLNNGCAWCSSPQTLTDPVRWIGIQEFICKDCKLDPFVLEYIESMSQSLTNGVSYVH